MALVQIEHAGVGWRCDRLAMIHRPRGWYFLLSFVTGFMGCCEARVPMLKGMEVLRIPPIAIDTCYCHFYTDIYCTTGRGSCIGMGGDLTEGNDD